MREINKANIVAEGKRIILFIGKYRGIRLCYMLRLNIFLFLSFDQAISISHRKKNYAQKI